MSFWSDASPITKGVIVVGPIVAIYFALALFTGNGLVPFAGSSEPTTGQQGVLTP